MAEGSGGLLMSVCPPSSGPAWTTAFTGVNPGKHGIYCFVASMRELEEGRKEWSFYSSRDRRYPAIWNRLSADGVRTAIINVPMTSPPEPVNGVMISGIPHLDQDNFAYPLSLRLRLGDSYPLEALYDLRETQNALDLDAAIKAERKRFEVARGILDEERWGLFWHCCMVTDRVQHFYWRHMVPGHPLGPANEKDRIPDAVLRAYQEADFELGEIMKRMDASTTLAVISDHGFGEHRRIVSTAPIFARKPDELREVVFFSTQPTIGMFWIASPSGDIEGVDPQLRAKAIRWLKGELEAVRDPQTGGAVIERVMLRDEMFWGQAAAGGPDIFAWGRDGYYLRNDLAPGEGTVVIPRREIEAQSGEHKPAGIAFFAGRGIRKGGQLDNAWLADVTPTILHFLGEKIPEDADGRVLKEILDHAFAASRPIPPAPEIRHPFLRRPQAPAGP